MTSLNPKQPTEDGRIANGDTKAMPPDPDTAPKSARGTYRNPA